MIADRNLKNVDRKDRTLKGQMTKRVIKRIKFRNKRSNFEFVSLEVQVCEFWSKSIDNSGNLLATLYARERRRVYG